MLQMSSTTHGLQYSDIPIVANVLVLDLILIFPFIHLLQIELIIVLAKRGDKTIVSEALFLEEIVPLSMTLAAGGPHDSSTSRTWRQKAHSKL